MKTNTEVKTNLLFRQRELESEINKTKDRIFNYENRLTHYQALTKGKEDQLTEKLKDLVSEEKARLTSREHQVDLVSEILSEMFYVEPKEISTPKTNLYK